MGNNNRRRNRGRKRVEDNYIPPFSAEILALPLSELALQPTTAELLGGAGLSTILDIVKREEKDLYKIKTFNKKNLFDVLRALKTRNLFLKPTPPKPDVAPSATNSQPSEGRDENNAKPREERRDRKDNRDRDRKNNRDNRDNRDRRDSRQFNEQGERFVNVSERATKLEHERKRPPKTKVEYLSDSYVKMNKNGKWGFMNREGQEVVEARFDDVSNYKEDLCSVELDGKMGYIDREGNFVIEPQYELAMSFSEGYANVYRGEKCGYIDKQNNVVVEFLYDAGTSFADGNCRVKKDDRWGELYFVEQEDGQRKTEVRWII